jgi:hypothetical protein
LKHTCTDRLHSKARECNAIVELNIISKDKEQTHVDRKHILKRENTPVSSGNTLVLTGYTLKLGNAIFELNIIIKDREQTHM